MVEKPAPEDAPSRLGVAGRYILTPGVFDEIRNQPRGAGGEIQLTDGIARLLRREKVLCLPLRGQALRLRQQGRLPGGHRRTGAASTREVGPASANTCKSLRAAEHGARRAPLSAGAARGRSRRPTVCCSTSSLPVWLGKGLEVAHRARVGGHHLAAAGRSACRSAPSWPSGWAAGSSGRGCRFPCRLSMASILGAQSRGGNSMNCGSWPRVRSQSASA